MDFEVLVALFTKMLDERLATLPEPVAGHRGARGPRGLEGAPGRDGKDFVFAEHEPTIRAWAKEFALKFSDLSAEEINQLRGPRGRDGKDFNLAEHEDRIRAWAAEHKLTFADLSADEVEQLRGPRGRDGRQGRDGRDGEGFDLEKNREGIEHILADVVAGLSDGLKLKFSDLTEDEKLQLRGPRGQRGKPGKDFVFEEHAEYFASLKPTFKDFSSSEREQLKLHFKDLTDDERNALKLKFADLTDDDKLQLRGPRGQRGRAGRDGVDGINGKDGKDGRSIRGAPGPMGAVGRAGRDGLDGLDGQDAPVVTDVEVLTRRDEVAFVFTYSDGTEVISNYVTLPSATTTYVATASTFMGGGSSSGSGGSGTPGSTGADGKSAYQIWLDQGNSGTESDFLASLKGADGAPGPIGSTGATGATGPTGADGTNGADGQSAYDIWLAGGNTGTEADFLASLKGATGAAGARGPAGADAVLSLRSQIVDANDSVADIHRNADNFVTSVTYTSASHPGVTITKTLIYDGSNQVVGVTWS